MQLMLRRWLLWLRPCLQVCFVGLGGRLVLWLWVATRGNRGFGVLLQSVVPTCNFTLSRFRDRTKLQHAVQTTPPAAMSFTGVLRRNGYFGRQQRARRPKQEGVRSRAAFRSVGEAGSVQHKAKRLAQPLELPPLVTVDEGGQPRDVRVSTLQFVAGMGRYAVLPCYMCRRTCKGTMTAEASRAAAGIGRITTFALIPAIVFAFGWMDLSPTEAFAAVVGIAVVLCFDYTGKGQLSDVLESTTIDPLDANIGPAPLSKDEVPRIVVLMCIGGGCSCLPIAATCAHCTTTTTTTTEEAATAPWPSPLATAAAPVEPYVCGSHPVAVCVCLHMQTGAQDCAQACQVHRPPPRSHHHHAASTALSAPQAAGTGHLCHAPAIWR